MKKALIKTLINEFLAAHKLTEIQAILDSAPDLYQFLKKHELKPLPSNITYGIFEQEMLQGVQQAQMRQMMGNFQRR